MSVKPVIKRDGKMWACGVMGGSYDIPHGQDIGVGRTPVEAYRVWNGEVQLWQLPQGYLDVNDYRRKCRDAPKQQSAPKRGFLSRVMLRCGLSSPIN